MPPRSQRVCYWWRETGTCKFGSKCWFLHSDEAEQVDLSQEDISLLLDLDRLRISDQDSSRVAYLREQEAKELAQKRRDEEHAARIAREAAAVDTFIVSEFSLVEFGAGLEIHNVVAGFDLCRITIRNLPTDATCREIAEIFLAQGVSSANFYVLPPKRNGKKLEAVVWVDAAQGQVIAVGLEGVEFRDEILSFEVGDNANWNIGRSHPSLTVSWYAPSEVIDAKYVTIQKAEDNMEYINTMSFKGRRMRAILSQSSVNAYQLPSLRIMGCPIGSSHDPDFTDFVRTYSVRVTRTINFDEEDTERWVRTTLRSMRGALKGTCRRLWEDNPGSETRFKIQFEDYQYAKDASDYMAKSSSGQRNAATLRCWLPKPNQHLTSIPWTQYQAQRRQWDDLEAKKEGTDAYVRITPGTNDKAGVVFINVVGEDKKAAGPLKVRVENLVAGEKLDSTAHWHPFFTVPSRELKDYLDLLYDVYEVYARYDAKARCLRIYGEKTERAAAKIADKVKLLSRTEIVIELNRQELRYFLKEGLGKLEELVGDDNVELDIWSKPAAIILRSGAESEHHLQRLLTESRLRRSEVAHRTTGQNDVVCPICTDNASNPERLGCGHTYCTACLKHFLTSPAAFPLVCIGDDGNCKVPIALPFISRFLPAPVFRAHIESAFAAYVERHSRELKFCTTADCPQIYRRRRDVQELQCPSCFSTICPSCDKESHEGMTCRQRRIYRDPELQEKLNSALADEQGWKRCPDCDVLIEKIEGCNHIECRCGAHICWKCMGVFGKETVYDHLKDEHGGMIYDAVPEGVDVGNDHPNAFVANQRDELLRLQREQERQRQRHYHRYRFII